MRTVDYYPQSSVFPYWHVVDQYEIQYPWHDTIFIFQQLALEGALATFMQLILNDIQHRSAFILSLSARAWALFHALSAISHGLVR